MLRQLILDVDRFLQDDQGLTAVEYSVSLALILVACIGAIVLVVKSTKNPF
jgi:Flp pilus assembly pilin Flp